MNSITISKALFETKELVFDKLELELKNLQIQKEGQDYSAAKFELNNLKIIFREAKITPTKTGQFVTLWKRIDEKSIHPFAVSDTFDFVIIKTKTVNNLGQFIFPKSILQEKGILFSESKKGKLGFRVYPSWDKTENKQAHQTQEWQSNYFLEIPIDYIKAKALFSLKHK